MVDSSFGRLDSENLKAELLARDKALVVNERLSDWEHKLKEFERKRLMIILI